MYVPGCKAPNVTRPVWLSWLGAVSYSVYLLHYVVIYLARSWLVANQDGAWWQRLGLAAGYLAALLVLSYACYRLVELPFQALGRRVVKRLPQSA
jgi:peptidoglycan/LPS O-acetylase OafA/YrhL